MPEIVRRVGELEPDLASAIALGSHMDDATFPFFLREAVHQEKGLAGFDIRGKGQSGAVSIHG